MKNLSPYFCYWFRGDVRGGWLTSRLLHRSACRRASSQGVALQRNLHTPIVDLKKKKRHSWSRFIATVGCRALTISPAMRGGRGVVGISSSWEEMMWARLQVAAAAAAAAAGTVHTKSTILLFSTDRFWLLYTDQVVLTAYVHGGHVIYVPLKVLVCVPPPPSDAVSLAICWWSAPKQSTLSDIPYRVIFQL